MQFLTSRSHHCIYGILLFIKAFHYYHLLWEGQLYMGAIFEWSKPLIWWALLWTEVPGNSASDDPTYSICPVKCGPWDYYLFKSKIVNLVPFNGVDFSHGSSHDPPTRKTTCCRKAGPHEHFWSNKNVLFIKRHMMPPFHLDSWMIILLPCFLCSFVWVDDSTLLVCTISPSRGAPPKKPLVPFGPKIQSNEQKNIVQLRTYQDLLKDEYDEDLFDYYATSQLILASLDGTMKEIGPPAVYTSIDPSPDDQYLLISSIHRPYSFIVPCGRFPKKVDVWTTEGKFIRELCDLPLAENIPIAFNSVRKGMRSISWRADKPSTLYWYIWKSLFSSLSSWFQSKKRKEKKKTLCSYDRVHPNDNQFECLDKMDHHLYAFTLGWWELENSIWLNTVLTLPP